MESETSFPYSIAIHDQQAKHYKWREPYLPQLFKDVCARLGVSQRSHLADMACGTGEVARELAKYAGRVSAIDGAPEMIANAVPHERVAYRVMDLGTSVPSDIGLVDHLFFGRSIHWFSAESLRTLTGGILRDEGSVIACATSWVPVGSWGQKYDEIKRRHLKTRTSTAGWDFTGESTLTQVGFRQSFAHSLRADILIKKSLMPHHILSLAYRTDLSALEANFEDLKAEMNEAFKDEEGDVLKMRLTSWACAYRR